MKIIFAEEVCDRKKHYIRRVMSTRQRSTYPPTAQELFADRR